MYTIFIYSNTSTPRNDPVRAGLNSILHKSFKARHLSHCRERSKENQNLLEIQIEFVELRSCSGHSQCGVE